MLEYGCNIPYISRCIVFSERTISIRLPVETYRTYLSFNCFIDISYNTAIVGGGQFPRILQERTQGKVICQCQQLLSGLIQTKNMHEQVYSLTLSDGGAGSDASEAGEMGRVGGGGTISEI